MKASEEAEGNEEKNLAFWGLSLLILGGWLGGVFMALMLEFESPGFLLAVCMPG